MAPPKATLHALRQKLPEVEAWVEQTVACHANQARSVSSFGFCRLADFYPASLLQTAKVVIVPEVPVPPLSCMGILGFQDFEAMVPDGITYLDTYFLRAECAGSESLHFHELVHVIQWLHLGAPNFILAYALGHLRSGGYRENPLEKTAYALQARFDSGEPALDVDAVARALAERDFWLGMRDAGLA